MAAPGWRQAARREKSDPGLEPVPRLLRADLGCSKQCRARDSWSRAPGGVIAIDARLAITPNPGCVNVVAAASIELERRDAVKAEVFWTATPSENAVAEGPALVLHEGGCRPPGLLALVPGGILAVAWRRVERNAAHRANAERADEAPARPSALIIRRPVPSLYALRTGTCKTAIVTRDGHDQIIGYHIAGEIIGADGIAADAHECDATALEDMDVCPLPFDQIDDIARISDQFRRNFVKLLSRETARTRSMMIMLGTMCAEQRLAAFLLDLSQRYGARGYSTHEFVLRMTRSEIGSYLGLKLETVSRLFSRFQQSGLIEVRGRAVTLLDCDALNEKVESGTPDAQDQRLNSGFHPMAAAVKDVRDLGNSLSVSRRTTP